MLFCVISYNCSDKRWGPNGLHHWLILNKCLNCTFNFHKLRWFTDVEKIRFYSLFLLSLKTKSSFILFSFTITFSAFFSCKLFPLELKVEYVIIYMLLFKGTGMEGFPPPKKNVFCLWLQGRGWGEHKNKRDLSFSPGLTSVWFYWQLFERV